MGDARSARVILVGACLLDQNLRFPGIAVEAGACGQLIAGLMGTGAGVQALPCLECLEWGGVARRHAIRLLPVLYHAAGTWREAPARLAGRLWLARFRGGCRREARRVAARVADLRAAGCRTVGLIMADDSPTCGVTRTIDVLRFVPALKRRGFPLEALLGEPESLQQAIPEILQPGTGVFARELERALARLGLKVPAVGYNPWVPRQERGTEVDRVLRALDGTLP